MLRGIERRTIFLDDADREEFLRRLSKLVPELGFLCFAWVLMPNHVHLVVRSAHARISNLMARLGTGYARYFNERHHRVGHLFQNRFRSRRAIDDADLMGLVLYVTRNPLEAAVVPDGQALERFPWCGFGAVTGHRQAYPFEAVGETLALFDTDPRRAQDRLRSRLDAPGSADLEPVVAASSPSACDPTLRGFETLLGEVCVSSGLRSDQVRSRGRSPQLAAARSIVARRAAAELGMTGAEIGRRLGLSKQAVSVLLARADCTAGLFGRLDERPRSRG